MKQRALYKYILVNFNKNKYKILNLNIKKAY